MGGLLGVPPLDRLLGKIPKGARFLLLHDPGTDGQALMVQSVQTLLADGGTVVHVAWDRAPSSIRRALQAAGVGPDVTAERLLIVDAHTGAFNLGEEAAYRVPSGRRMDDLLAVLHDAADAHGAAWIVFDSLSGAVSEGPGHLQEMRELLAVLARFRGALCLFTEWPHTRALAQVRDGFEAILRLRAVEDGVIRNQAFAIEHLAWAKEVDRRARLISVGADGSVEVHIPKLVITGPEDAGKTTFIQGASDTAVSADRMGTTVALDRGRYEAAGVKAELFGTPGQERFDPLLATLFNSATAAVLLVDASKPRTFGRAEHLLSQIEQRGLQLIVIANKQDHAGAMKPEEVRKALGVKPWIPVLGLNATDKKEARKMLEDLLDRILREGARP